MKGLKNIDFKKFFVDHGEKIGLGVVAALGLAMIALARWSPYDKHPQEFISQVETAQKAMAPAVNPWPEDQKAKYAAEKDISADAEKLRTDLDLPTFSFPASLSYVFTPVIAPSKPIGEPTWFPVEKLIVDDGTGIFAIAKTPELLAAGDGLPDGEETGLGSGGAAAGGKAAGRGRNNRVPETTGLPGGDLISILPTAPKAAGPNGVNGLEAHGGATGMPTFRGGGDEYSTQMGEGLHGGGGEGYGAAASGYKGEPRKYVIVRGVFPLREQLKELADELNLPSASAASDRLMFHDFELVRQTAVPGPDPWAGEWVPVDQEVARDMLLKVINFDQDEIDLSVMDPVFTMPLPARIPGVGTWGDSATHPALASYELTAEGKKKQEFLIGEFAKYAAAAEEMKRSTVMPGGFAGQVVNVNKGREALAKDKEKNGLDPKLLKAALEIGMREEEVLAMISAGGSFALFRYIDFDVRPSNAYRYKVRLEVVNPSYGKPLDEVARADVAEGLYRKTPWSDPSPPVVVPRNDYYYLTDVKTSSRLPDEALFDIFEWSSKSGTFVNSSLEVEPGQFIGGTKKADVLDPAENKFEVEDYAFATDDVVVDIDHSPSSLAQALPELGLSRRSPQIPRQALVVNGQGDLVVVDPVSREAERQAWVRRQKFVAEAFKGLKDKKPDPTGTGMEGGHGGGSSEEGMMPSGTMPGRGGRGRGQNPLRRGAAGGSAGLTSP